MMSEKERKRKEYCKAFAAYIQSIFHVIALGPGTSNAYQNANPSPIHDPYVSSTQELPKPKARCYCTTPCATGTSPLVFVSPSTE
jgi:hypothetical protein